MHGVGATLQPFCCKQRYVKSPDKHFTLCFAHKLMYKRTYHTTVFRYRSSSSMYNIDYWYRDRCDRFKIVCLQTPLASTPSPCVNILLLRGILVMS